MHADPPAQHPRRPAIRLDAPATLGEGHCGPAVEAIAGRAPRIDRRMRGVHEVSVIGCVGSLTVATRGAAGAGEVLLKVRGTRETYLAWSEQPLPKGADVLVVDIRSARTVLVEPWPSPHLSTPIS
jgi:membrane protein implicated in regulation of membrane protease activity